MTTRLLPVPDGLAGERVDAALARMLGFSRTQAAELASAGAVLQDGIAVGKSDRLRGGALLEVDIPDVRRPEALLRPTPVPDLAIIHDDADLVVVDKPVGVAAHPSAGWQGPTVVGALAAAGFRISTSGAQERQGVVSRLDAGTSGLMVVAKSDIAYSRLKQMFTNREVDKVYHAVAQGHLQPGEGTIDAPIGRHPGSDWKFAVTESGRDAVSHYEVLEEFSGADLVRVGLETGRTHQIRVHFSAIHHPLIGDLTYGADPKIAARLGLSRQWLHAQELGFIHPVTGKRLDLQSPKYPADLLTALTQLRSPGG
jgi:23S rRNA pseudouridine1911/1915/1917 synthase